jgi:acylphosphatase
MKHLNIRVKGRVQGVFFRASACEEAGRLGVKGFARNEPDGSVYIEAEGDDSTLQLFLKWCANGPGRAVVESVTTEEGVLKNYTDFVIGY